MSIATTAPEKFDFQDLVCAALALRFEERAGASLIIEPSGGEDAELGFEPPAGGVSLIEVQVKGTASAVTLASIAECLTHFPPRKATGSLLERLIDDPFRVVLLVMTGRCDDAASRYVMGPDWDGATHPPSHIRIADTKALLQAFKIADLPGKDSSKLKANRKAHIEKWAQTLDPTGLRTVLERLIVLERVSSSYLEARCEHYLRARHRIPSDRCPDVIARLQTSIKRAKSDRFDAFPLIRTILKEAAPPPLRPVGYVDRGQEKEWTAELSQEKALLLSGPPRCGKSDAAMRIASDFQSLGYEVRVGSSADEATRFLLDNSIGDCLYVLDDPLGGTRPVPEPERILERFRTLVPQLTNNRKLIVAQTQDLLFAIARQPTLAGCAIAGHLWHDLSAADPIFLSRVWTAMTDAANVPATVRDPMAQALADGVKRLELGCLRHLASNYDQLPSDATLDHMVQLAREDAGVLGRSLAANPEMEEILAAMAIGSSPRDPIAFRDLAFLLGAGGETLPGKRDIFAGTIVFGSAPVHQSTPVYEKEPKLDREAEITLDQLERRCFVEVAPRALITFTHPFYRAAAESVLSNPTSLVSVLVLRLVERGLFCLAAPTSRATARNLDLIYEVLEGRSDSRDSLIECAVAGLQSIFPGTRDLCFSFLLRQLEALTPEQRSKFPSWVNAATAVSLDDIEWQDGEARLPSGSVSGFELMMRHQSRVQRSDVAEELEILEEGTLAYLSPQRAAKTLKFFAAEPEAMSISALMRFLSYDEAVIRAESVRIWLFRSRDGDEDILQSIFDDGHPSVVCGALEGAVEGWADYNDDRRNWVLEGLAKTMEAPAAAAAILHRLVVFNRVEYTGESPPWPIFGRLLPIVFRALPSNMPFEDTRLFAVTKAAVHALEPAAMAAICDGWITWLERETVQGRLPSDYSLAVLEILVEATRSQPELRSPLIERLLSFPNTGALLTFVKDFVDAWPDLATVERAAVLELLASGRTDQRWLRAAAITREEVPSEIQRVILGSSDCLADTPSVVIDKIPPKLLEAAVAVHCGHPQPLWWLGVHHSGGDTWDALVEFIAQRPDHPQFEAAFGEAVSSQDGTQIVKIIQAAGPSHAERLFQLLLRHKVIWNGNWLTEAWAEILEHAPSSTRARWLDRMAEVSPAILDNLSDLRRWLTVKADWLAILERLEPDCAAMMIMRTLTDKDKHKAVTVLEVLLGDSPLRIFGTCDQVRDELTALGIALGPLEAMLSKQRTAILQNRDRLKGEMKFPEPLPEDWISP